jgi:2-polyprenyl-3-methyl-5-hydroxy-6-metoxy-1,4-benzoquinol methylase
MDFPNPPKRCAACETNEDSRLLETHRDTIEGKDYRVLSCPSCGVVFSEPRQAVGGEWYAAAAPLRLDVFSGDPKSDRRFGLFLSEDIAPGKLLDIGCGDGGFLALAQSRGWRVAGFDYDARVARAAREKGLQDVSSEEFLTFMRRRPDEEFDAVTLFDVLEHTPEPLRFIEEVRRLLRPGGNLAVTLPNALRPLPWGREAHDFPPHHFTRWTPETLKNFLENNGFKVLRLEASELPVYYLAEHFFYYGLMRVLLPSAKRFLFGKGGGDATISDLYKRSGKSSENGIRAMMGDPKIRHRTAKLLKLLCAPFSYSVGAFLTAYYLLTRPCCGEHLYVFARRVTAEDD